jgi:molybdenum cofactor guanylyltransferase
MKIFLLIGKVRTGKTTRLAKWIEDNTTFTSFSGILSPVINGKKFLKNLETGELLPLETAVEPDIIKTGSYSLSKKTLEYGKEILQKCLSDNKEWIIIDEFGKLENEDQGLNPSISRLLASNISANLLIVIRESLMDNFLAKYKLKNHDVEEFNYQHIDTTAFILSGGNSSRMGSDKGLLHLNGSPVIERIISQLKKTWINVNIISNNPLSYNKFGIPVHQDIIKNFGPLSGIHSALSNSLTELNMITTSDMLLIPDQLFSFLAGFRPVKYSLMFKDENYIQPFPGIYSKKLTPQLEDYFKDPTTVNGRSVYKVISSFSAVQLINPDSLEFIKKDSFFNMNTPEDYKKVQEKA